MAYLALLCGLPFAGKTTLAQALVHELPVSRVAIDDINAERGVWNAVTGLSPEEWTKTYDEAYRRIDLLLHQGKNVVDDSANFTRALRDRVRTIATKYGVHTLVIFVTVPVSVVCQR